MISVYFDNCCYHRPYDDQKRLKVHLETEAKMHIQKMITDKQIDLVYSFISEFENSQNPNTNNSRTIANFFKNAVTYVDISYKTDIRTESLEIMKTGIKATPNNAIKKQIYSQNRIPVPHYRRKSALYQANKFFLSAR